MHGALLDLSAPAFPSTRSVMGQAGRESFPVAARVLSRRDRRHLLGIYGFARLADELGDELVGDRLGALDWLELELDRAYEGRARHPLLRGLQRTLVDCSLPRETLVKLIDANRLDQRVTRYQTWEQLSAYCELSANPVGELVLRVFGLASCERIELSDSVCTGLQLVEHLGDLGEDVERGRMYLPAEDIARFGCSHEQLATSRLREAVRFEAARARRLLDAGPPLVSGIRGRPKLAVAAFVAGGRAALGQIERARFEVLAGVPRASRPRRAWALARVLVESRA